MAAVQKALATAYDLHVKQERKCTKAPYFVHILDVAKHLMAEPAASEDVIIAGILHDTLEDTPYTAEELERDFGPNVCQLVVFATEPTKDGGTRIQDKRQTWKARKKHTVDICQTATKDQLLVLLADKLSNLQSIHEDLFLQGAGVWDCFNADREDIAWCYQEMRAIFRSRLGNTRMFQLYERLVDEVFC